MIGGVVRVKHASELTAGMSSRHLTSNRPEVDQVLEAAGQVLEAAGREVVGWWGFEVVM